MQKRKIVLSFSRDPIGFGGGNTFQTQFMSWLKKNELAIIKTKSFSEAFRGTLFVMHGSRHLILLLAYKIFGTLVLRMDGTTHNELKEVGLINYLRGLRLNLSNFICACLADVIIVQSKFILKQNWWLNFLFANKIEVIRNGVDLEYFYPGNNKKQTETVKLVSVEGTVHGSYAAAILGGFKNFECHVFGRIDRKFEAACLKQLSRDGEVIFHREVTKEKLKDNLRKMSIFVCLEKNPPCPNSVLEALACGLPVVGFDNGSLLELVGSNAGIIVKQEGNKISGNDIKNLNAAISKIISEYQYYSDNARIRAQKWDIKMTFSEYFKAILAANSK